MEVDVLLNGPFNSYSLFYDLSNILNCTIVPTSIKGNRLNAKFNDKFNKNLLKHGHTNSKFPICYNLKLLSGQFFIILLNQHSDTDSKSYYYLSLLKVELKTEEKAHFYSITPLESNTIYSNSFNDLYLKYESFIKCTENGFNDNFFGNIKIVCDTPYVINVINSYTFNKDFKSFVLNDLDSFLFDIWASISIFPHHEYNILNSYPTNKKYESFYLPNVCIHLSGSVLEYLCSDVMVLPDHLRSTKFSNVEELSDFSEYSDSDNLEDTESPFDFSSEPFLTFFGKVTETIKNLGGSVIPLLNGSYMQDGCWMINNSTICNDLRDVILLLKGSTGWQNDHSSNLNEINGTGKHELKLFLYKIPYFNKSVQFRVFTYEGKIVLISQLFFNNVYDYLLNEQEFVRLLSHIFAFYNLTLVKQLPQNVSKVVIDLYIINKYEEIYVTNISPWNTNDENVFSWAEIYDYVTSSQGFAHDASVKVKYFDEVAFAVMLSNKLSRHKLCSFCPEDVEEFAQMANS